MTTINQDTVSVRYIVDDVQAAIDFYTTLKTVYMKY